MINYYHIESQQELMTDFLHADFSVLLFSGGLQSLGDVLCAGWYLWSISGLVKMRSDFEENFEMECLRTTSLITSEYSVMMTHINLMSF